MLLDMQLQRHAVSRVKEAFQDHPVVTLLGGRHVGKSEVLAACAAEPDAVVLDLAKPADHAKLNDPVPYLKSHAPKLLAIDNAHLRPEIFPALRGILDARMRLKEPLGRFLFAGNASHNFLRAVGGGLGEKGRFIELSPLGVLEVGLPETDKLWVRGGRPKSFLAASDEASFDERRRGLDACFEPSEERKVVLQKAWPKLKEALVKAHGTCLANASIAADAGIDPVLVQEHVGCLIARHTLRQLPAFMSKLGRKVLLTPKTYIRDSGLLHAELGLGTREAVLAHSVAAMSWEGFVVDNLVAAAPFGTVARFYHGVGDAIIDLVLCLPGHKRWAIEIRRNPASRPTEGFLHACEDVAPTSCFLAHAAKERYPIIPGVMEAVSVHELASELSKMHPAPSPSTSTGLLVARPKGMTARIAVPVVKGPTA